MRVAGFLWLPLICAIGSVAILGGMDFGAGDKSPIFLLFLIPLGLVYMITYPFVLKKTKSLLRAVAGTSAISLVLAYGGLWLIWAFLRSR